MWLFRLFRRCFERILGKRRVCVADILHYIVFTEVALLANCHLIYKYFNLGAAYVEVEQEIAP